MSSPRTLWKVSWRYLLTHSWQSLLMLLGITLGVAVVVAVDLANTSASRAFDYSAAAVAGRATHQVVAGPQGLDEALYTALRVEEGVQTAAPVVAEYIASPQLGGQTLQLLGVDPFAEPPFRSYLWTADNAPVADLADFLTQPGALLISTGLAAQHDLSVGDPITVTVGGYERAAFIAGLVQPADALSRRTLESLVLADIATAQELTDRLGRLDRIDLILPQGDAAAERIRALLPSSARIVPAAGAGAVAEMTAGFRLNLTALSLLALLVGMFLIYNTMTFSVVQRRPLFGTLRCLGVTRREVFALVLAEALVVGLLGAVFGLLLGIAMGQIVVGMVTQTINDLYLILTVRSVEVPLVSLVKGGLLGVFATALAAALPAWEAASVPARAALSRSGLEAKAQWAVVRAACGGVGLLALGAAILALPTRSIPISFGGTSAVVVGFAMLTPLATRLLMGVAMPITARLWGVLGRMAPRNVVGSLSRTSIAVAALMVAMAVTIGVSLMIGSFRHTVILWLNYALQGDIYVAASDITSTQDPNPLDPAVEPAVWQVPGVAQVDLLRSITVDSPQGPIYIEAGNSATYGYELQYASVDGSPGAAWDVVRDGTAVIVSEPLANRLGLPPQGGTISLYTNQGLHEFAVSGVYYDYATTQGTVIMALDVYRQLWEDDTITALVVKLAPGADLDEVLTQMRSALAPLQGLLVSPNQGLRETALEIFDRTFAITGALQVLATVVAFIGVLSALLSLQLDKQRDIGILRAVGLTARELWGLVLLETGLMGAVAGLLAMPAGLALSLILVYIINLRSFGWTLQMRVVPLPFAEAFAVAVAAALLAGIHPAHKMGRMIAAEALRYE